MLALISPAKKLDFSPLSRPLAATQPQFEDDIRTLASVARRLKRADLKRLMDISDKLADLNHDRFQNLELPFTPENAKPAVLAFNGDTYAGLDAKSLKEDDLIYAQDHLRILSGLYGLLRPLDLIQAYRLEMGIKLATRRGEDLYDFWGGKITKALNEAAQAGGHKAIINLASLEYAAAVRPEKLKVPFITAVFREVKNGEAKIIGLMAKRARGMMARYIIVNRLGDPEGLKAFAEGGYRFQPELSTSDRWEFHRPAA